MNCIILAKVTAGTGSTGKTVQHRMKSHPTAQSPDVDMNWGEGLRRDTIKLKGKEINNISGKVARNGQNPKQGMHRSVRESASNF